MRKGYPGYIPKHAARKQVILEAEVDHDIVPVVEWLNGLPEVITLHSCQGEPAMREGKPLPRGSLLAADTLTLPKDQPYVTFFCGSQQTLLTILWAVAMYGVVEVNWHEGMVRHTIRFRSKELMETFTRNKLLGIPSVFGKHYDDAYVAAMKKRGWWKK
jgi:hypothetical protein